jgi:hypothetical protein
MVVSDNDGSSENVLAMRELENYLNNHGLAENEIQRFRQLQSDLSRNYNENNRFLNSQDVQRLSTVVERIESSLNLEIGQRRFSEIKPAEGALDYSRLLSEGPQILFREDLYWQISAVVQQDLKEAVTSLSFGAPTASAMISLRAVEGMLRGFYTKLSGEQYVQAWGGLLKEIEKQAQECGLDVRPLLGYCDYLRTVRNQADHPDRSFSELEGEGILNHAVYTIQEIQRLTDTLPR